MQTLQIRMLADWSSRKAGQIVDVLAPKEPIRHGAVDPLRATQLVKDGLAELVEPETRAEASRGPAEKAERPVAAAKTKKGRRGKKSAPQVED